MNRTDLLLYLISTAGEDEDKLIGRKKLMKLVFFAEHFDPDSGSLRPKSKLDRFTFEIYKYGPFSTDVMDTFDDLEEQGLVDERDDFYLHNIITITDSGGEYLQSLKKALPSDIQTHLDIISEKFGHKSGKELENQALTMLGIEKSEKDRYRGIPIENIINSRNSNSE